jgi:uncharacterized damage-inducible protein DinB
MPVSADTLRLHLDYSAWASQRLMDVVANLAPEEITRDFQTSDGNILHTLSHVFAADRVWLARVQGKLRNTFIDENDRHLATLQREWPLVYQGWKDWCAPLTDETAQSKVSYRDLKGNAWEQPVWQILLHVVNHGTHHRGQVSGFLRSMGHAPPPLDLIAFYRSLG